MFIEGPADRLSNAEFSLGQDLALSAAKAIKRPDPLSPPDASRTYDVSPDKKNVPCVQGDAEKMIKSRL